MIDRFALIVGAMKCGTTALFHLLRQHPEISACSEKEPNFFLDPKGWPGGYEAYEALYEWDPARHRWALEASTNYAKMPVRPSAAPFVRRTGAEVRIVYVVREPVERIRSQYLHSLARGWIRRPIHEGVAPEIVLMSSYGFQMVPYEACFGRDAIHVVSYEAFRADPLSEVRRLCRFLEIDPNFPFQDVGSRNSSDGYLNELFARALNRHGLLPAPVDAAPFAHARFAAFRRHCALLLAEAGRDATVLDELEREVAREYTPSPEQAEAIRAMLREDLDRFAERYGIDPRLSDPGGAPRRAGALQG